ncbi:MAG: hypothetical protein C0484_22550 [Rhodospirillum sp.]|nr:hypothetical protein [Rhodospirillum sp.]
MVRSMKFLGILVLVASVAVVAPTAAADPVVDAFYNRCVSENAYQMAPNELESACACMAPVMVSFLTDDARRQVEEAIKNNAPVSLGGSPFKGNPSDLARSAIQQCPGVGKAMYAQRCAGGNEAAPQCQEMKSMIDQAQ